MPPSGNANLVLLLPLVKPSNNQLPQPSGSHPGCPATVSKTPPTPTTNGFPAENNRRVFAVQVVVCTILCFIISYFIVLTEGENFNTE